jgi:nicotinate-nucleotide adenylyltransferase
MKTGLLGGTFNPVHLGHLVLAQDAVEKFELDRVFLVPCAQPPHKGTEALADAEHRYAMLEAAVCDNPFFEPLRIEMERGGISYSIDTVRALQELYPEDEFLFLIGADTLPELHTWHAIYELLDLCTFAGFARPGFDRDGLQHQIKLDAPWPERLLANFVECHWIGISSTEIRRRVAEGMSIRYLVPPEACMYICEHGLYQS